MRHAKFKKNPYKAVRKKIKIESLNNAIDHNKTASLISSCEKNYFKQIEEAVSDVLKQSKKKIICIAGPTSSGKTTTSENVKKVLEQRGKKAMIISLDNFLVPLRKREILPNGQIDYESFDTIDTDCLQKFIHDLFEKGKAEMPEYDFVAGNRKKETTTVEYVQNEYIVIEGLHAFNPELLEKFEDRIYKIYICPYKDYYYKNKLVLTAKELRLMRRCIRDNYKRGHNLDKTFDLWSQITESEYLYIKPYRFDCDYFINSSIDYEICIYANYLKPLLEKVKDEQVTWPLFAALDKLAKIDKKDLPSTTLLWEFLKVED